MPKVVPSQIIALIDQAFPNCATQPKFQVHSGSAATLSAIVSLAEEIPDELLTISGEDYTDLIHGMEALAHSVEHWNARGGDEPPKYIKDKSPVAIIREALDKCRDESPSPGTAELTFISDVALRESIRMDMSTANSAIHNAEWKAATVLAGAAVEALLLWSIQRDSAKLAAVSKKPKGAPEDWGLAGLIDVSVELGLIRKPTADQARLGKDFRNLIHPGRAQQTSAVCNKGTALAALAAAELVATDLS